MIFLTVLVSLSRTNLVGMLEFVDVFVLLGFCEYVGSGAVVGGGMRLNLG